MDCRKCCTIAIHDHSFTRLEGVHNHILATAYAYPSRKSTAQQNALMDFNMCQLHSRRCNRQSMQSSPMAASRNFFFSNFSSFVSCFLKPNLFASASSLSFSARCAANRSSKLLSRTLRISKIIKKRKQECYQMSDNTNLLRKN